VKIEHQRASGLLQPLDIPVWKWDEISMDFVTGLPRTQRRHDAIWVVMDHLTKSAYFLPIHKDYSVSKWAETFQQEIVRLHGTPSAIVGEHVIEGPEMIEVTNEKVAVAKEKLKEARTRQKSYADKHRRSIEFQPGDRVFLKVSTACGVRRFGIKGKLSPRFIGPFEILDRVGEVSYHLALPPQLSYVHNVGERVIEGPEMIEVTNAKVSVAKEKLKEARTRQKSYADMHRRALEFQPGDHVFLKVSPARGVRRFGIKGKLSPRFIGPFEILDRVGEVSYRLELPPQLSYVHDVFHVSLLRGYKYHPLHVITYPLDQIRTDLSYEEEPEAIIDRQDRIMRKKTILFVKILWRNHPKQEATWETEESIRTSYPHFLP
nr:DNA/RNA polymerases superfamily protein [Tanacetum cinerariifolium]